jgi:hypothetical protein
MTVRCVAAVYEFGCASVHAAALCVNQTRSFHNGNTRRATCRTTLHPEPSQHCKRRGSPDGSPVLKYRHHEQSPLRLPISTKGSTCMPSTGTNHTMERIKCPRPQMNGFEQPRVLVRPTWTSLQPGLAIECTEKRYMPQNQIPGIAQKTAAGTPLPAWHHHVRWGAH